MERKNIVAFLFVSLALLIVVMLIESGITGMSVAEFSNTPSGASMFSGILLFAFILGILVFVASDDSLESRIHKLDDFFNSGSYEIKPALIYNPPKKVLVQFEGVYYKMNMEEPLKEYDHYNHLDSVNLQMVRDSAAILWERYSLNAMWGEPGKHAPALLSEDIPALKDTESYIESVSMKERVDTERTTALSNGVRLALQTTRGGRQAFVSHHDFRPIVYALDEKGHGAYFYKSLEGTDDKQQGKWYAVGGILAKPNGKGNWIIKGTLSELEDSYGRPDLQELAKRVNEVMPKGITDNNNTQLFEFIKTQNEKVGKNDGQYSSKDVQVPGLISMLKKYLK